MNAFVAFSVLLVIGRLTWLGDLLRRIYLATDSSRKVVHRVKDSVVAVRITTTAKLERVADSRIHDLLISVNERQLDTSLLGGSVALAAWTQLFVSSGEAPAKELSTASLNLLFGGALVLILAPMLFRVDGLHTTYLGREIGFRAGYGVVLLSLLSIVADLSDGSTVGLVGLLVLAAIVVGRDLVDVYRNLQVQSKYNYSNKLASRRIRRGHGPG